MIQTIYRYIRLSIHHVKINLLALMQYRADLIIGSIAMIFLQGVGILSIWVVLTQINAINGWSFDQVLFIYALSILVRSIWHIFFMGLLTLTWYVRNGMLDRMMIRPLPILFQLCHDELDDDAWGETILALILLVMAWYRLQIPTTAQNIGMLFIFLVSGTLIYNALTMIASTFAFWTIQNAPFISLISDITELTKFPLDIYSPILRALFTFALPIGFIGFYPAQFFFDGSRYLLYSYFTPVVAIIVIGLAALFWRIGLSHYQSTGS